MEIRVPLAMGVAAQVDGHPVHEDGEVGAVVRVEPPNEVLLGLAPTLVLVDDQPRHETKDVGGPPLGPQFEVLAWDHLFGGGCHRRWGGHGDRRQDLHRLGGRLSPGQCGPEEAEKHGGAGA